MKIPVDEIPQSPKEISFSESVEELNEIYAERIAGILAFRRLWMSIWSITARERRLFFSGRF